MNKSTLMLALLIILAIFIFTSCTKQPGSKAESAANEIILATTTSTQDSGLLDLLLPKFHAEHDFQVKTIAVGTGKALKMAEDGFGA